MDEAERVRELQRGGDPALFGALVEAHRGQVFRVILSLLGPGRAGEAEELAQEAFVKAYRKLDGFRGDAAFGSWLYRIAYNLALDHRSRLAFQADRGSVAELEATPDPSPRADPFTTARDARRRELVGECLRELPPAWAAAVHLHYWLGMTVPEIAVQLGSPEGTIKSHLHRARARLHEMLLEKGVEHV